MRLVPRNDPEANALAYKSMETPLRKILQDYSKRNTRGMMERITSILTSAGYDGSNGSTVLIRKADPSTIRTLEELALRLPDGQRQRMMARMYGQIGAGSLSVRKAVQDVIQYGPFLDARKMHQEAQDVLRQTAREGMYRGEFMVQKAVGVGWQMETPSIKQVDAFLKDKWSMKDATAYLKPMSQVMRDQVTESIFLGESPQKMAKRMERVDEISKVRANRNARTITTAVANEAQMDSYKRDGIKKYRWVATFDERTCPACGSMDGREFELGKGQYPPLHPNCRCTTVAVLDKAAQDKVNAIIEAHKGDKGAKYVPPGMTYEEWASKNITPAKPRKPKADQPTKRQETAAKNRQERYTKDAEAERVKAAASYKSDREQMIQDANRSTIASMRDQELITKEQYDEAVQVINDNPGKTASFIKHKLIFGVKMDAKLASDFEEIADAKTVEWDKAHVSDKIRSDMVDRGVEYRPVQVMEKPLTHDEIVKKIGGSDKTAGSCASQALTYIANQQGLDVVDFRDGKSRLTMAENTWEVLKSAGDEGTWGVGLKESKAMLDSMEPGETYCIIVGRHCSLVRAGPDGPQYLELQDVPERNGWRNFEGNPDYKDTSDTLKRRFAVKGRGWGAMVNIKDIAAREDILETLGYINTDPSKAARGAGGSIK